MFVFQAEKLKEIGTEIFTAQGMTRERAEFIADTLVEANLTGHDSHGVFYFVRYSDRIRERFIDPKAEPTIAKETASTALIDGRWAPGQITALKVTETAVEKAKRQRISAVGAFRCNHIGRGGYYTNLAASRGVAALMFVNVGHPAVTVFNGTGSVFGTNPFSAAVPTGKSKSFLLDYATSVVAEGKISVARSKGEKIPTHWTRVMELLGAVMTGSRTGFEPDTDPPSTNGVFAIAFDPEAFIGLDNFRQGADELFKKVKHVEPEPGKRVLIPGEPEWETKERRLRDGIPIPEETWNQITELTSKLGIEIPE